MKNYDGHLLLIHEFFSNKNPKNFVAFAILKEQREETYFRLFPLLFYFFFLVRFVLLVLLLKALHK